MSIKAKLKKSEDQRNINKYGVTTYKILLNIFWKMSKNLNENFIEYMIIDIDILTHLDFIIEMLHK